MEEPVDWSVLAALVEEIGDEGIAADLVAAYLEELPERREAIVAARDDDPSVLRAAAHGLGSASLTIGANAVGLACRAVEAAVDDGRPADARTLAATAITEIDRVQPVLVARYGP